MQVLCTMQYVSVSCEWFTISFTCGFLFAAYLQICRALGHIHKYGICHRDIKPQNLLVNTENHQLKLCDFGSAKVCR